MDEEKKTYREGDTEDAPQDNEEEQLIPETAFLAVKLADGTIDVIIDLKDLFPTRRQPTIGEIRNMSMALAFDGQAQIIANSVSAHLTKAMQQVVIGRQIGEV